MIKQLQNYFSFNLSNSNRFWELDFIKGVAIVGVIFYHFCFDLVFFYNSNLNLDSQVLWLIGRISASTFIFISGLSFGISSSKRNLKYGYFKFIGLLPRFFKLFCCALAITLTTYIISPEETIVFGILHFLAIAPLISYFFVKSKCISIILALIIFIVTPIVQNYKISSSCFVWLGLEPSGFMTLDYFPLIPWLSLFLIGIAISNILYKNGDRQFNLIVSSNGALIKFFSYIGQYTLILYLVHQPLIFLFLKINLSFF